MNFDGKSFGTEIVSVVRSYVDQATAPLQERIATLESDLAEARQAPSVCSAVINNGGVLILVLSDGSTKEVGQIVDPAEIERQVKAEVAKLPAPKDGKDGFGLDDFDATLMDDGRTVQLSFTRGDVAEVYELGFPVTIDRGVYVAGKSYEKGDGVTWGGSWWIAQRDTDAKPETSDDWRLAVKRGRDGKSGDPGKKGDPGEPGRNGRDLTQIGPGGEKW